MAFSTQDWIESAAVLDAVTKSFEDDLRAGLKQELMALAEQRVDALVDETVKRLETKMDAMRDNYSMRRLVQVTVRRLATEVILPSG